MALTIIPAIFILSLMAMLSAALIAKPHKSKKGAFAITLVSLIAIILSSIWIMSTSSSYLLFGYIGISPFSAFFITIIASGLLLVEILAYSYSKSYPELIFLMALSFVAMLIVATSQSLLPIMIGLEMITVATSFMILLDGKHRIEAAVKLFVIGSLSIGIFSFAMALIFQYLPSLVLMPAQLVVGSAGGLALLSLALFITAIGFECALFPFNFWVSDVYQGAPTLVTTMIAGLNKKVGFIVMIEILFTVFLLYINVFSPILALLAIVTMFFGNLLALSQKSLKRMFAYSSISQAGYILIGLSVATQSGVISSLFYIFAHAFMIIGAFAIVLFLESNNIKSIEDCTGLYSRNGFIAISLTLIMLSMAGIPPLIGFFGKLQLFISAISSHLVILAIVGIINSFISIYYYARVINVMFDHKKEKIILLDPYIVAVVLSVLVVIVLFGLYPQPLIAAASNAYNYLPRI